MSTGTIPVGDVSYHHYYCHPRDPLTVTATHNAVRIVIVATSIGTGAHGDDPSCLQCIKDVIYQVVHDVRGSGI